MILLVLLSMIPLAIYTAVMIKTAGSVPQTLSQSVFYLPKDERWIWTVMIYLCVFLVAPVAYQLSTEETRFVIHIALCALAFVGAAPLVNDIQDLAFKVHCVAAVMCATASQVWILLNIWPLLLLWIPWLAVRVLKKEWKSAGFWAEMVCFASIYIACIYLIISNLN